MNSRKFIDKLFPPKYDFYKMLKAQADLTAEATKFLFECISDINNKEHYTSVLKISEKADEVRIDMENKLIQSFVTPFDRQDIYSISKSMDKLMDYIETIIVSMQEYSVECDDIILSMIEALSKGTMELAVAISLLKEKPLEAENYVRSMREKEISIEQLYRKGMVIQFNSSNTMEALKRREVYHHIKDSGKYLGYTVDVFHKIVVRLV